MRQFAIALCLLTSAGPVCAQDLAPTAPAGAVASAPANAPASALVPAPTTLADQERFLLTARLTGTRGVKTGVTGTQRATLSDGSITHDASIQTIDETVARFESPRRIELNFRDYWGYNVAAYRIGVMLGLDMIPPSVKRRHRSKDAAFTWWIDGVIMDERARSKDKQQPPDPAYWNAQIHVMRVFDELIANTDRNQGNMLIDRGWKLWLIDHSRAFRITNELRNPAIIRRCDRTLLERMKSLTRDALTQQVGAYLTGPEQAALLKRRDRLVAHIETLGATGLYEFTRP